MFLQAIAFYLITSHQDEEKRLLQKKITKAVSNIVKNKQDNLVLGNLDAKRDWGHAKTMPYAQWLILQQDRPDDYVIASGETHTIREFVEVASKRLIWKTYGRVKE